MGVYFDPPQRWIRRPRWNPCHGTDRSWTSSGHGTGSGAVVSRSADSGDASRAFGAAPSTRSTEPLMNAAAGDKRKQIAAETSDSVPSRAAGIAAWALARWGCIQSG